MGSFQYSGGANLRELTPPACPEEGFRHQVGGAVDVDSAVVTRSHGGDKVSHLERHIKFLTVPEGWELSVNVVSPGPLPPGLS